MGGLTYRRQRPQVDTASRWVVIRVTVWVKKKRERVRGQQRGCEGRRQREREMVMTTTCLYIAAYVGGICAGSIYPKERV